MAYRYDVFISYKRHPLWTPWTLGHFRGLLDAYLTQDLGRRPDIFVDERIEPGADWPETLGTALGSARVMVAVFSLDYFGSDWCMHELDLMHARRQAHPGSDVIVPVLGHDGEHIPDEIGSIQRCDITCFRNPYIQNSTGHLEQFAAEIQRLTPSIASAIHSAPAFDSAWPDECRARFREVYRCHCANASLPVRTITPKPLPGAPLVPPRVTL